MTQAKREIEVLFSTLKNSPFPLAQGVKLHINALVLGPCLIPYHRCEKSAKESRNSHHLTMQRDIILRENLRHVHGTARIYIVRMAQFVLKNRKIVPYQRSARIPRLTVSVPDCGS